MFIGQHLAPNSEGTVRYFTPWFPQRGNSGTFVLDIIDFNVAEIKVQAQTKNSEDPDPNTTTGIIGTLNVGPGFGGPPVAVGQFSAQMDEATELVRFQIEVSGDPNTAWIHCRMLNVSWQTN